MARVLMMQMDLNANVGEVEPLGRTRTLMRYITSANIACGGHAGDLVTMERCVRFAREFGVRIGAFAGIPFAKGRKRSNARLKPREFSVLLLQQIGALERIAGSFGVPLHHLKLNESLAAIAEEHLPLRRAFVETVLRWWPDLKIYALAGSRVAQMARRSGLEVWEEAVCDRGYTDAGLLIPAGQAGAVLRKTSAVTERILLLLHEGKIKSRSGKLLDVTAHTVCIHADSPRSVQFARAVKRVLTRN